MLERRLLAGDAADSSLFLFLYRLLRNHVQVLEERLLAGDAAVPAVQHDRAADVLLQHPGHRQVCCGL